MTVFVLLCVGLLQTAQIGIIDLDSTGASKLIDKSDEGESIEGLSSFFVGFRLSYRESNIGDAWDGSHGGYLTKGTAGFVLWALSGYAPGQPVNIYAHWHFQRNETLADYQVNSWPERIQKKHFESPATNDLVLVDGRSETCYFEKLGCYCADEGGRVEVVLTYPTAGPATYVNADALAFEKASASPPHIQLIDSLKVEEGEALNVPARVEGFPVPSLQWQTNGVDVAGATNRILRLSGLEISGGEILCTCRASNASGVASATTSVKVVKHSGRAKTILVVDADENGSVSVSDKSTGNLTAPGLSGEFEASGICCPRGSTYNYWVGVLPESFSLRISSLTVKRSGHSKDASLERWWVSMSIGSRAATGGSVSRRLNTG